MHNDYSYENPQIPAYAPTPPAASDCLGCGNGVQFYTPPDAAAKDVEILAADDITVEDLSDALVHRFRIGRTEYIALTTIMTTLTPYIAGVNALLNGLGLFGRTIDRVDLVWTESKEVTIQTLTSSLAGFVSPTILPVTRDVSLTGKVITIDTSFTITGNDGAGKAGSISASTLWVRFGNLVRWGKGSDKLGGLTSSLQALFNAMTGSINTNTRARSFNATGGVNEHEFYFLPVRFGETVFQKGIFVGGFVRLKNVNGVLYQTIPDGETEDAIPINNGYASENYYVYMSLYDNQVDPTTPIVAS